MLTSQAIRAGFGGGVVVDYPNSTKAKKIFLCLFCGVTNISMPKARGTDVSQNQSVMFTQRNSRIHKRQKSIKKSRDWIEEKKERRRRQGKNVRSSTKYSGRKRKPHF